MRSRDEIRASITGIAVLGAWTALLIALIVGLDILGRGRLRTPPLTSASTLRLWAVSTPPQVALFAVLRLGVLAMASYLLVVSMLGLAARLTSVAALIRAVELITPHPVRHLVVGAVGISIGLSATPLAGPAMATVGPRGVWEAAAAPGLGPSPDALAGRHWVDRLGDPESDDETPTMQLLAVPEPGPPPTLPGSWRVRTGDNLWDISRSILRVAWGQEPTAGQVVPYWRAVIAANDGRIADPSLIFAGQVLVVPAPSPPVPPPPSPSPS